ncbi:long-chain-fatty-acid--CoA ligase FadD17 [Mycobacteroides abscessus subsp. bolletii 1513]|uniref:Long-chain-fatty-acid--CoA ligase FadD17 n=1 Tax=Mycobacteroides abscessus subsp. bolletii 1513 TaxID=1299321 RepID=X8DE01_9MYCO|nr:long-chain-fatty-acid--CoA ligase FadD17 [Mycobacteroides abscessus subsp. bolletii 1513]
MSTSEDATVTRLLVNLADVEDRGLHFEGAFTSWRDHIAESRRLASVLRARLDPSKPPHIGVILENTPGFARLLTAAALAGLVLVGLNSTRRGSALRRDIELADCQFVVADESDTVAGLQHPQIEIADVRPDDLFMLIFTSGTSGDPKAVQITHAKVASAGTMLSSRFGLGSTDVCYLSMPMFHSNAVMAGWSVAVAAGASIALRRKFSASGFLDDVREYGQRTPTTSANPCLMCWRHRSAPTTPRTRCGSCTATRLPLVIPNDSQRDSAPLWSTGSGRPRAVWHSGGRPARRRAPSAPSPRMFRFWISRPVALAPLRFSIKAAR